MSVAHSGTEVGRDVCARRQDRAQALRFHGFRQVACGIAGSALLRHNDDGRAAATLS